MYKIYNWLFGWDYITWESPVDQGVARVHQDKNGNLFYWRYNYEACIPCPISSATDHLWLTCSPEKYGLDS
jgi:hypothetical protein